MLSEGFKPRDEFTIKAISAEPAYGRANIKQNHSIVSYKPYKDWCGVDYLSYELKSETESLIEQVKINVSCAIDAIDANQEVIPVNTVNYVAKIFDADGDGLKDIYIQKRVNGRHQDFYLKQKYGATFSLVTTTNSSQAIQATMLEESEIIVIRADFNGDGMLDFLVSNIDAYIWGADEQIILAKKKDSSKLDKIIAINEKFRIIRDFIENVLRQPSATPVFVGLYNNTYSFCRVVYLPYMVYSNTWERWVVYYVPVHICMSGRSFLDRYLRYDESFNYIASLSAIDQTYGLNGFQGFSGHSTLMAKILPNLSDRQLIETAKTVKSGVHIWRAGSIGATVILLADDVTVVGVLNDVGLLATVGSIALAYIVDGALDYYIVTMEANSNSDDVGVTEGDATLGAGSFAIPGNCDPRTPGQKPSRPNGDSGRLRENLKLSNCGCEQTDGSAAAHHIIPKSAGGPIGDPLRQCLKNRNIGIDSVINGVCLPRIDNSESNAFLHKGSEGNLHGVERLKELLELCESNSYSNREFEDLLRQIADGYTKGIMLP